MDQKITYSIIIPHKNIPDLLQRCLKSVPRREDVQIIIVDDNSDTDRVSFDQFPGLGDSFVEIVFTKEGKGAGYARNVGLARATGKWLLFADADDYFTNGFLQILDIYNDSNYEIIYFGLNGINGETKRENAIGREYRKRMMAAKYKQKYDAYKYTVYGPYAKMIKHSLINENNIVFDETKVAEDVMFSIKSAYCAKTVFFDEQRIYTTESRRNSLTTSIRTLEANFDLFCVVICLNVFLKKIAQKRFKKNVIPYLCCLVNVHNMAYFRKGLELMKENKIKFMEILQFSLLMPFLIIKKSMNILLDKI